MGADIVMESISLIDPLKPKESGLGLVSLAPKTIFLSRGLNPGKPTLAGQWLNGSGKYTLS
jgi:hypothetical protein